jgi:hypothetical protein
VGAIRDRLREVLVPSRPVRPWRDTLSYLIVGLTLVPGYFALALGKTVEKIALSAVTAIGLVLFLVRLTQGAFEQQLRVLRGENEALENLLKVEKETSLQGLTELSEEFRKYKVRSEMERSVLAQAVDYTVATQVHFYEEQLEIEVIIGQENGADRIIERHTTRPVPGNFPAERAAIVPFRRFRPIIPSDPRIPITFADLQMRSRLENGSPVDIKIFSLTETRQAIVVFAKFTPALDKETTWVIEYISPGLWEPLRRTNSDQLAWEVAGAGGQHSPFRELVIRFVFPSDTARMSVRETDGEGTVKEDQSHTLGPCQTWVESNPKARKYHWEISYTRTAQVADPNAADS